MRHFFKKLPAIFLPEANSVSWLERFRSVLGVVLGLLAMAALGLLLASYGNTSPWIVAPMGASAFLLFVLPSVQWRNHGQL